MTLHRRSVLKAAAAGMSFAVLGSGHTPNASEQEIYSTNKDPQNHDDPNLHLVLDERAFQSTENLTLALNKMKKHPRPVLVSDRPWEGDRVQAWGSVIQEPSGLFRMWYFAFNTERRWDELDKGGYCYAESYDGVTWEKPDLDLFDFRGSRRNNIFYLCNPDGKNLCDEELARRGLGLPALDVDGKQIGIVNNLDGLTVVRDDDDPDPSRRYKLVANMQDHRMWAPYYRDRYPNVTQEQIDQAHRVWGQYVDTSPDGIHWTRRPRRLLPSRGGDYMMVMRDHRNKRWWLNERAHDQGGRNASLRTSNDWRNWSDLEVIYGKDSDPNFNRTFQWHGGMTPFNYGTLNIGLLETWPLSRRGAECELIIQKEGGQWQRPFPDKSFMECGAEGEFDRILAYPSHNPPGKRNGKLLFFYTGGGVKRIANRGIPMAMGLATIGLDRFAGLAHWRNVPPGRVITRPLRIPFKHFAVNIEYAEITPMRLGVTNPDGSPIAGYSLDESRIEVNVDHLYSWAKWKDKDDLSELVDKEVVLQFEVNGAVLYSYRFVPERKRIL